GDACAHGSRAGRAGRFDEGRAAMKRRFDFRLARVARVRELEERVARAERAQAEGFARAAETRATGARNEVARARAWLSDVLSGRIDPRRTLSMHRVLDGQQARLRSAIESARTLRTQAERMAALHRARKAAARALEELRARALGRHRA